MSRSGILAGDSPPAGVVLAVRPEGWVVWWARLLVVSVSLCGLLMNTGCQPTSDMVMRKDLDDYKAKQETVKLQLDRSIADLASRLKSLEEASPSGDAAIERSLDAEREARLNDVQGARERIATVERTIATVEKDFNQKIDRYSDLDKREQELEEQFGQLSETLNRQVVDLNGEVDKFRNEFSIDMETLRSEYRSLLIALKEHYQRLSLQLNLGQDAIRMQIQDFGKQIEDFGKLAQSMAERSGKLVKEASDIIDTIEEQTREFRTDLDERAKDQEAEQEAPTEQP